MIADIRFAIRRLLRSPGYTFVALATLALGIGVNTSMFTVLNAEILSTGNVRDANRLVAIDSTSPQAQDLRLTPADIRDLKAQATSYEAFVPYSIGTANYSESDQPAERLMVLNAASDFLGNLGMSPELGRFFTAEEDNGGGSGAVVLVSDQFWKSRLGADPKAIGTLLRLDGVPHTIVGVMSPQFDNPIFWGWGRIDVWRPLNYTPQQWQIRNNRWMSIMARLKPGVTVEQAQAEATTIATRLASTYPTTNANAGFRVNLWNHERVSDLSRRLTWLLMGLSGFVLLIACANLANLQMARAAEQVQENALRLAIGASRFKLARQFLIESVIVALGGGLLGLLVAIWGTRILASEIVVEDVAGMNMPVDGPVLVFCLCAAVGTGILFGIFPALSSGRTDVNAVLKQGGRGSTGGRNRQRVRQVLVVGQFVLTLALLSGAGFFIREMRDMSRRDLGWKSDGLVIGNLCLSGLAPYDTDAYVRSFLERLDSRLRDIPGSKGAFVAAGEPVEGLWRTSKISIEGRPAPKAGDEPVAYSNPISPGYFSTLGVGLVRGRFFTDADRATGQPVAIINESMANKFWPGEDPLGKKIGVVGAEDVDSRVIVGVVKDIGQTFDIIRNPDTSLVVYKPFLQVPPNQIQYYMWLGLRTDASAPDAVLALRRAVTAMDPRLSLGSAEPVYQAVSNMVAGFVMVEQILGAFAVLGLVLAAVGLYGIVANTVSRRTSEIGIRMALGAQVKDVMAMLIRQGMILAGLGSVIGLVGAWYVTRALSSIIPLVRKPDTLWLIGVAALLVLVAFVATWIPARRASKIEPVEALRSN